MKATQSPNDAQRVRVLQAVYRSIVARVADEAWQRDCGHLEVECGVRGINAKPGRYTTQGNDGLAVTRQF